jgi:thioredoxin 1
MESGAEETALVDFWASWCGPCKQMAPNYEEVAEEMEDEPIDFYKIDIQQHPELSEAFHVQSVPTLILVHDGEVLDTAIGALSSAQIRKKADWLLSKARGEGFFQRLFG